jgi:hypothetical protein
MEMENGSPRDFPKFVYHLLIVQTEVCRLSICWRRYKRKLTVCKQTKQTKWTYPSLNKRQLPVKRNRAQTANKISNFNFQFLKLRC